jgi:chitodextrinase
MKRRLHTVQIFLCGLLLAATGAFAQTPVANYPFSGSARDVSANGNNATINGATLTQDRFGWANSAFNFDGAHGNLKAPNAAALNSATATVSFWINVNQLPVNGEAYVLSYGGWQERWKISLPNHGKLVWTTHATACCSDLDAGGGNEVVPGVWKHMVFVHDGTNDIIYANGVQVASKASAGALSNTVYPLGIGFDPIDNGNYFNGSLDEVQLFDTALSAGEIAALFAAQSIAPSVAPGKVASYSFSNNAKDATSFGNNGTTKDVKTATDRFGYGASAYVFNGTTSEVTASNSAQLNSDFTSVSFWVKPNTLPVSGEVYLLSFGGWQQRFKISLPGHGKVVWTTNALTCCSDLDAGGGNELVPGTWTHVVVTHDGTEDKIFINGAMVNSKSSAGALKSTTYPLGIGYNAVDGGNWFDGTLDEVDVYNYALSNAEVADLYTATATFPGTPTNLVADYQFSGNGDDHTQFGNNAGVGGAAPTTDRFGYASNAYQFAGVDSVLAANSIQLNSDFTTVSFWVKVDELPVSGEAYLLSYGGWQERWKISLPSHGKPVWTTNALTCCSDLDSGNGNELPVGVWKHVVMVHNGTKDKIYINGALKNEKDAAGALKRTKFPLGIGNNPIDAGNYFKGSLDDIQIYNVALDDAAIAALFAAQNAAPTITDDLVANYTFTGDANDETPFHNNAQVIGAQLSNDRFGKANHAYTLSGTGNTIKAANSPQQNHDYTTVSFWVNVNELPVSGESYLLSNGGWQQRWKISLPSHGKVVWSTKNSVSGNSDMDAGGGNELPIGEWKHVVMIHDGTNDKIFIDGALVASKAVGGAMLSTTYPLGIGHDPIDGGSFFNGSLDDIQIYNRALTDAEVAGLFTNQSAPPAVTDTQAPDAPLNLAASVAYTNVSLTWWPANDNVAVTSYNLYQNGAKILTTSGTATDLSGLPQLTTFAFGVTAVDAAGNESLPSTLQVTTGEEESPDVTPPSQPGNLVAATGAHSVLLAWDASTDDRGVKGYVIFVDGTYVDTINTTSILVGGLDAETPYSFEVYAFDNAGNNSTVAELTVSTDMEIDAGEPGLVAWYPFEGNANDATPYLNHGAIGGNPIFESVTHPNGGAKNIKFDGTGDSVLVPNAVQLISDYTTVGFWIRVDSTNIADAEAYVLDFGHWSQRWKISLPQHLKIVWTTNSNTTQFPTLIHDMDSKDGNEMIKGYWWYVTMVHDGTSDIIYVNGEEVNKLPAPGKLNTTGLSLGMGNNPIEGKQYFIGGLDEVKIYNKALTGGEIKQLFNSGTTSTDDLSLELLRMIQGVYPNPATDVLWVKHAFDGKQPLLVRIMDVQGRQVGDLRFDKNEIPAGEFSVNVKNYPTGTYFLNVVVDGKSIGSVKFEKQ